MIETLFFIQVILVLITDISGFPEDGLKPLFKKLTGGVGELSKLFTCSFCQMNWVGLAYLIVTGQFSFAAYALVLLLAFMTPVTGSLLYLVRDFIQKMITTLYDYFNL